MICPHSLPSLRSSLTARLALFSLSVVVRSHDNSRFASCGGERLVYLWDVSTGRILRRYQGHFQRINAVDFNSESTVLASGASWCGAL